MEFINPAEFVEILVRRAKVLEEALRASEETGNAMQAARNKARLNELNIICTYIQDTYME